MSRKWLPLMQEPGYQDFRELSNRLVGGRRTFQSSRIFFSAAQSLSEGFRQTSARSRGDT